MATRISLKAFTFYCVIAGLWATDLSAQPPSAANTQPGKTTPSALTTLAFTHATVIDVVTGAEQRDWTVVTRGDKIVYAGPAGKAPISRNAVVHDETGRFVVPGLWDSHVHLSVTGDRDFPLFIANGITSLRDMGSVLTDIRKWQNQRKLGALIPRIITPGPKLDGMSPEQKQTAPFMADRVILTSPGEARQEVRQLKAAGVDFLKVHQGMSEPIYSAIIGEAREVKLPVDGHLPFGGAIEAAEAGQRTIEHGISRGSVGMLPCSADFWRQIEQDPGMHKYRNFCAPLSMQGKIFPEMVRHHVWFCPTLASGHGHFFLGTSKPVWSKGLQGSQYVWPELEKQWSDPLWADDPPTAFERILIPQFGTLTASAAKAGVHLLAGTDVGDPYVIPGFSLHDELDLMVQGGVPTLTALQSATIEPARAFGFAHTLGQVKRGFIADLVILGANPLADINNARQIDGIIVGGRLVSPQTLSVP